MITYNQIAPFVHRRNFYVITQESDIELYRTNPYQILIEDEENNDRQIIYTNSVKEIETVLNDAPDKIIYLIIPTSLYNHIYLVLRKIMNNNIPHTNSQFNPTEYLDRTLYELPIICFYQDSGEYIENMSSFYDPIFTNNFNNTSPYSINLYFYSITINDLTKKNLNYLKLFDLFSDNNIDVFQNRLFKIRDNSVQTSYNDDNESDITIKDSFTGHNFMNDFIHLINEEFPEHSQSFIL